MILLKNFTLYRFIHVIIFNNTFLNIHSWPHLKTSEHSIIYFWYRFIMLKEIKINEDHIVLFLSVSSTVADNENIMKITLLISTIWVNIAKSVSPLFYANFVMRELDGTHYVSFDIGWYEKNSKFWVFESIDFKTRGTIFCLRYFTLPVIFEQHPLEDACSSICVIYMFYCNRSFFILYAALFVHITRLFIQ